MYVCMHACRQTRSETFEKIDAWCGVLLYFWLREVERDRGMSNDWREGSVGRWEMSWLEREIDVMITGMW